MDEIKSANNVTIIHIIPQDDLNTIEEHRSLPKTRASNANVDYETSPFTNPSEQNYTISTNAASTNRSKRSYIAEDVPISNQLSHARGQGLTLGPEFCSEVAITTSAEKGIGFEHSAVPKSKKQKLLHENYTLDMQDHSVNGHNGEKDLEIPETSDNNSENLRLDEMILKIDTQDEGSYNQSLFVCSSCYLLHNTLEAAREHCVSHQGVSVDDKFQCNYCGLQVKHSGLLNHMNEKHQEVVLSVAEQGHTIATARNDQSEKASHELKKRDLSVESNLDVAQLDKLIRRVQMVTDATASGKKDRMVSYVCRLCLKTKASGSSINKHIAKHRRKLRKGGMKCKFCDQQRGSLEDIADHTDQIHLSEFHPVKFNTEKPCLLCPFCSFQVQKSDDLVKHCLEKHPPMMNISLSNNPLSGIANDLHDSEEDTTDEDDLGGKSSQKPLNVKVERVRQPKGKGEQNGCPSGSSVTKKIAISSSVQSESDSDDTEFPKFIQKRTNSSYNRNVPIDGTLNEATEFCEEFIGKIHKSARKGQRNAIRLEPCYVCKMCFKGLKAANSMRHHINEHKVQGKGTGHKNSYKCFFCKDFTGPMSKIIAHAAQCHITEKQRFVCPICSQRFHYRENYSAHKKMVHSGVDFRKAVASVPEKKTGEPCPICRRCLYYGESSKKHMKMWHPDIYNKKKK